MTYQLVHASAHKLPMADHSVNGVGTSPPYYLKRRYPGEQEVDWDEVVYAPITVDLQDGSGIYAPTVTVPAMRCALGREPNVTAYIGHLIACMREWRRVLHPSGTIWVNLDDTSAGAKDTDEDGKVIRKPKWKKSDPLTMRQRMGLRTPEALDPKNKLAVIERFVLAAQADGFIYRRNQIWAKGVSLCPEYTGASFVGSEKDATNHSYENVLMFSVSPRYFFNTLGYKEPVKEVSKKRAKRASSASAKWVSVPGQATHSINKPRGRGEKTANEFKRINDVWTIVNNGTKTSHFAVFPRKLAHVIVSLAGSETVCAECGTPFVDERKCGCKTEDLKPFVMLDPFNGSGTMGVEALLKGYDYIGADLAEQHLAESEERLQNVGKESELVAPVVVTQSGAWQQTSLFDLIKEEEYAAP